MSLLIFNAIFPVLVQLVLSKRHHHCRHFLETKECHIRLLFGRPLGEVQCRQTVPLTLNKSLWASPLIVLNEELLPDQRVLVVMIDTDALKNNHHSYLLWAYELNAAPEGQNRTLTGYDYQISSWNFEPKQHKSEVIVHVLAFLQHSDHFVVTMGTRHFNLCRFIFDHDLQEPMASMHFNISYEEH